jgi:predicted aspartyl protease
MGLTTLRLRVGSGAAPEITEELEFVVDSGAVYSVVPAEVLGRLGVQPLAQQEFRLANGTRIVRRKGVALFRFGDRVGGADVIFGEPEDALLLGAFTLESLGLCLDPLRRELLPVPMILAAWERVGEAVYSRPTAARQAASTPATESSQR